MEQRSTTKESAVLFHRRALVLTAAAAYRPIHYTQSKIPFPDGLVQEGLALLQVQSCVRLKERVHVIIPHVIICTYIRVILLSNEYTGVCNDTISKLYGTPLKRVLNIK